MATRATRPLEGRNARTDPGSRKLTDSEPAGQRNLRTLSPAECIDLLEPGGVGRIGFASAAGVVILPVNFALAGKTVVFRTAPDTLLAAYLNGPVSFETDHHDESSRVGWSILLQGHAHKIASEEEIRLLEDGTGLIPWAAGARDVWVRIAPARISGRRIQQAQAASPGSGA